MARIIAIFSLLMVWGGFQPVFAQNELSLGLISANNVEITTDSGEVLDQRLGIGDQIFIIVKPKEKRQGWSRISRSPTDTVGIGWVENKFVRSIRKWEAPAEESKPTQAEQMGEKTVMAPDVEPDKAGQVGVLPFTAIDADDPMAKWAYDAFSMAVKNSGKFQTLIDPLKGEKIDIETPSAVQTLMQKYNLDGLFVGNLSGDMGQNRLLQIKYFGKGRESAVLEKVKKIPKEGKVKEVIDNLAGSCISAITPK